MFGFLPSPCGCSSTDAQSAWQSHFCGLCNTLRGRYGLWSRWLINRDSTFLALAGSALATGEPVPTRATCCNPLGRKRLLVQHEPQMRYAAAVTICALTVKLRDDAEDERGWRRKAGSAGGWLLRRAERKARADLEQTGFPVDSVAHTIGGQSKTEMHGTSLATASGPTAQAYGSIFGHLAEISALPATTAPLTAAGAALGRMIYTVDAWEDYTADIRHRRFNPLPARESSRRDLVADSVQTDLGIFGRALTDLPLRRHAPLLLSLAGPRLQHRTLTRIGMAGAPPLPPPLPPDPSGQPVRTWAGEQPPAKRKQKKPCECGEWCAGCSGKCCGCGGGRRSRKRSGNCCDGIWCIPDCGGCGSPGCDCDCPGCDCSC